MPKFLIAVTYTAEGLKGLQKDKASGRRRAAAAAIERLGGQLECFYYALGEDDVFVIADLPDHVTAATAGIALSSTGLLRSRTTALLTPEEVDRALEKTMEFRPPGG